jgi:hypothetical protein
MWLFTQDGFFSVVRHRDLAGWVMVKARNRVHLARVLKWVTENAPGCAEEVELSQDPDADYFVRANIPEAVWVAYLTERTSELPDGNVKGNIMESTDPELGHAMYDVWETMLDYQRALYPESAAGFR